MDFHPMIITSIGSKRSSVQMNESRDRPSSPFKMLVIGSISLALVACGGEDSTSVASVADDAGDKPKALVSGQSLLGLGPLSVANLATFEANGNGVVSPSAVAISTSSTDTDGAFEILVPLDHTGLQIASFGGNYIDRTDQGQNGSPRREISLGSTDTAVQAWLPAGEEVVVLNLFTEALYIKSLGEASGGNFDQVFQINRQKAAESMGFDIVSTVPSIPVSPGTDDGTPSKQYGILLGGLANAVNAVSVKLGLPVPDVDVLRAVALDLVDGDLDGTIRGVPISTPAGSLPNDVDLASEVVRFRNNNFRLYETVEIAEFDGGAFGAPTNVGNTAPIANDDSNFVAFRGQQTIISAENGVLQNDSDPEGNPLFASLVSQPAGGSVVLDQDGGFTLDLSTTHLGVQTFTYVANDLSLDSEPATVSISVDNVAPTVVDDELSISEGDAVSISVLANDSDDIAGLVIDSVGEPEQGSASIVNGQIQYIHAGGNAALDEFSYSVIDVDGAAGVGTVTITIQQVNDAPELNNPFSLLEATEEQLLDFVFADDVFTDDEGDQLTFTAVQSGGAALPSWLTFIPAQRRFTGIPDEPDLQNFNVDLIADDGNQGTAVNQFSVVINTIDDAPVVSPIADQIGDEDQVVGPIAITISDADTAFSNITLTAISDNVTLVAPAGLVVSGVDGSRELTITPAAEQSGSATITYSVFDGLNTVSQTFSLTVNSVNDLPAIEDIADVTANEDEPIQAIPFSVSDVESPNSLIVTGVSDNSALISDVDVVILGSGANRSVALSPNADQSGIANITITVDDGTDTVSDSFALEILPENDAPTITQIDDQVSDEDQSAGPIPFTVSDIETPAGDLVVTAVSSNQALVADADIALGGSAGSRTISYQPIADQNGSATITVTVSDGGLNSVVSFVATVNGVNDAPSFVLDGNNESVAEDSGAQSVAGKVVSSVAGGGTDEVEQVVSFLVTNNNNALFAVQPSIDTSGVLTYTPAADQAGSSLITVQAQDDGVPAETSPTQVFSISITAVNDDPSFALDGNDEVVGEDSGTQTVANKAGSISPGPANESGQSVSFVVTNDNNTLFAVQPAINPAGQLSYVPAADVSGGAIVTVVANDSGFPGASSTAQTFAITVDSINDAPSFALGGDVSSTEDFGTEIIANQVTGVSAGPADESDQTVSLIVTNDNNALFSSQPVIDPQGALIFVAAPDAVGSAVVSVVAQDDGGTANGGSDSSVAQTFTITITPINDAPSFTLGGDVSSAEDFGTEIISNQVAGVSAGPANESGQTVSLIVTNDNNALFSSQPVIDPQGALIFVAAPDAVGTAVVSVVAQDDAGTANGGIDSSAAQTFTITITPVNDAPSFTLGGDVSSTEDFGTEIIANQVTGVSAGPADESDQTVSMIVTNDNNALFSSQPVIDPQGALIFVAAPDAVGSAVVSVVAQDDGGTANGGSDSSLAQTFTITVAPVNDQPSFNLGGDETVSEDSGAQTVANKASAISAGPVNESGQAITFNVSNSNNALFSVQPAIDSITGELSYTPAENANGVATITVVAQDDGGTANGGADTSPAQSFDISVTAVNDAPSLILSGNETSAEDGGTEIFADKVTAITAGPADESSQTVSLIVSNDNNALFSSQPVIDSLGALIYVAAPDANGSATVTVSAQDDGGTANGGTDTSATQTFIITVTAVNDAPSFVLGGDESSQEDAGTEIFGGKMTAISAGPADESGQTVSLIVTNDNNALFSSQPVIDPQGALVYVAAPDANGVATVSVSAQDDGGVASGGVDTSAIQTLTITVLAVNDQPSFVLGGDETVAEDSGAQTVANKASSIVPGPSNESAQLVILSVSNDNNALFAIQPTIDSITGELSYTPASDVNGTAIVTVSAQDDGGTANGGADTSPDQTFTITVSPVNDAPSFTLGGDESGFEDAGTEIFGGKVTAISAGPVDESGQTVSLIVTNDNNALFSSQPIIDPQGALVYVAAPDASGTAIVTVTAQDDGGSANSGVDTSPAQTLTITVVAVNDPPSFVLGGDETVAEDSGAQSVANKVSSIVAGPADEAGQLVTLSVTNSNNALFSAQPAIDSVTGELTYTPAADANGVATVTVSAQDDGGTANGGIDTSATQTFDIIVSPVNDDPSFTLVGDETVLEDAAAQSISNKATAIIAGPPDESSQLIQFNVTNDNVLLFSAQPAIDVAGTLSFTLAANANGVATVSVQLQDNGIPTGLSSVQTFDIAVTPVNDAPSFVVGADTLVENGAGAQTVAAHATAISAGPANESSQAVSFTVTNDNNAIFTSQPSIDASGTLTYQGAAPGVAIVSVAAVDDGGTADGGVDTSAIQTFTIRINALPVLDTNLGLDIGVGQTALVLTSNLAVSDPEDGSNVDFTVNTPACGGFELLGTPTTSFSQFDVDGANLAFTHAGCPLGTVQNASITASDQDGAQISFNFEIRVVGIFVDSANVAPNETAHGVFDSAIFSFLDEAGNPPSIEGDSVPGGVVIHTSFGAGTSVSDMGADLLVSPAGNFHAGELVRVHVTPSLSDTRGASAQPYLAEFHAAATGTGDGTFNPHPSASGFAAGGSGPAVEFGDVDSDGDLDAVLADDPALQVNAVWLNNGFGVFTPHATFTNFGADYSDIALGDINGDGSLDAVLTNGSATNVFLNDGTGDFSAAGTSLTVTNGFPVRLADLTGDGSLDLVIGQQGANDGRVFENDGFGNLAPHSTPTFGVNRAVRDIASGDFDLDGDIDLFITSTDQQNIWRNDGTGVFTRVFITSGNDDIRAAPFDVDRDGDLDIVLRRGVGGADTVQDIVVMRNDGTGTFALEAEQNFPSLGLDHTFIDWGDIDGDGDIDLISGRTSNVAAFLNDGNGNFSLTAQNQIGIAGPAKALDLADIDGDGDLDFIPSSLGSGEIEIWINNALPVASLNNSSIDENQANASVGQLSATLESGETDNYSLVAGVGSTDNALFEVFLSSFWELGVGQTPLNFENKASYSIRLQVTDGNGGVNQQVFTITANDVNEAPVLTALAGITVDEGAVGVITNALLEAVDEDATHGPLQTVFTLTTPPINGSLRLSGAGLVFNDTFTQQDIDNGLLDYDHVGNETTSDVFSFSVTDPDGLGLTGINFNIAVNSVNDTPVLVTNSGLTLDEGAVAGIDNTLLVANDADNALSELSFTVTTIPSNGEVQLSGSALVVNDSFTMLDVDNGLVSYDHFGGESTSDSFVFSLTDSDNAGPIGQIFVIAVNPVNDPPVVVTNNGLTLDEGTAASIDNTLLVASDVDDALSDVVFTIATAPANGELQRSGLALEANGTFSMQDVNNGLVAYVHLDGQDTADSFVFSLTDDDGAGPIGQTFSIVVNPINDAPAVTLLTTSLQQAFAPNINLSSAIGLGNLTFADDDAGINDVQLTITVDALATITVNDAETLAGKVTGNGTAIVQIVAPLVDISSELTQPSGIVANVSGLGAFNIAFDLNDLGNTGAGGSLNDAAVLAVEINSIDLGTLDGNNGITLQAVLPQPAPFDAVQVGSALTQVGDINADGFADYAIAASRYPSFPESLADINSDGILDGSENGAVYVVYGNGSNPNGFDLETLNGSNGFVVIGSDGSGSSSLVDTGLGEAISDAGDFNGDGIADLLIGAPKSDSGDGRSYLILGEAGRSTPSINLSQINDSQWVAFDSSFLGEQVGSAVASGDFNSDGISDVMLGAPGSNSNTGSVYVIFGDPGVGAGSEVSTIDLAIITNDVEVGIRFDGDTAGDRVGQSVAVGGVFGGGVDSLVIGSTMQASGGFGGFFAVKGALAYGDTTLLESLPAGVGTQITGDIDNNLGISVDVVQDMNGDGFADIVVGARDVTADGQDNAGWIVPGFAGGAPAADLLIGDASLNAIQLLGELDGDLTGHYVASAGDYNSDGLGDLLIGAGASNSDAGRAYLLFGSTSLSSPIALDTLDGSNGIIYSGVTAGDQTDVNGDQLGMAVSSAGDINGDGFDDILIGARQAAHSGGPVSGNAYLVFGSAAGNALPIVDASASVGTAGNELVLGGIGDQTLNGGAGNDILIAGPGADLLIYDIDDLTRVDGGLGDDILQVPDFGSTQTQDFAARQQAGFYSLYQNIESIELPDANRNDLYIFDQPAIRHMTDERNTLRIRGEITLPGTPRIRTVDFWLVGPVVVEGPISYNSYLSTDSEVRLLVDQRLDDDEVLITTLAKRASESSSQVQANAASNNAKISGNGQFVVYQSTADNLDAAVAATPARQHIYRTDLLSNETIMVSQLAGVEGDNFSFDPCISYDGSKISYATTAGNLVGTVIEEQILVTIAGSTVGTPISLNTGASTTGECDVSGDGNFVAYYSDDEILRYDILAGQNLTISTDMTGLDVCSSIAQCGGIALSGDGSLAVFSTPVSLSVLGDTNSGHDIVLANLTNGDRTLVTSGKNGESARPDISNDGNRIVFESDATNVTGFDSNSVPDIFIYNVAGNIFGRASTNDTGGATSVPTGITVAGEADGAGDPSISGDGEFVAWLGNQVGFSITDNNVSAYIKHVSGAINSSVLVGEAYRYHLGQFGETFAAPSDGVSMDFVGQKLAFHNPANNVARGAARQIVDTNGVDDIFAATNPIYVVNIVANSDGDALTDNTEIAFGTNPGASDSDGDGLNDFDEVNRDGDPTTLTVAAGGDSNPNNPDTDGDDLGDGIEASFNSDPSNPNIAIYVSQSTGADTNDGSSWATAYQTNAGVNGDEGYSIGGIDPANAMLVLYDVGVYNDLGAGADHMIFVGGLGPNRTKPLSSTASVIEASAAATVALQISGQTGVAVESLSFRHAGGSFGRAITISSSSDVEIRNSVLFEGLAGSGGGIDISSSTVTVDNAIFEGNRASSSETGTENGGAIYATSSGLNVFNSRFADNTAEGSPSPAGSGNGGAIAVDSNSILLVLDSVFIANQTVATGGSSFGGGGAISAETGSVLTVENSQFIGNTANGFGGAIRFSDEAVGGGQLNLFNNLFTANLADNAMGAPEGGAISVIDAGGVSMSNNTVVYNQADPAGSVLGSGGIGFFDSGQFNPPPSPPAIYLLIDNIIRDNADSVSSGEDDNIKLASSIAPTALERQFNNVGFNSDAEDIDADPVFTNGFYLGSQVTNPSVDGGSVPVTVLGLGDPFTTRADGVGDIGAVDIGFHYRKGNLKFGFTATANPGNGQCFGDVEQQFTISDFDGAPIGEGRTVVVDIANADPTLGNVTLLGVGSLAPVGVGSVLLRPLSNGNYGLTIQTDVSPQVGNLILDIYIDDLASPRTSVLIDYADACN